jgi:flagellar protein FlbD
MIRLTRLRNANPLYLNQDHIERLETHHETTVHMSNGSEYVVTEPAEEIVRMIIDQRAQLLAVAARLERDLPESNQATGRLATMHSPETGA